MRLNLHIETRGGVEDLGRVVGVMALLGLTPGALTSYGDAYGLTIEVQLNGEWRDLELCLSRLRALVSVITAGPSASEPAAMGRPFPCVTANL